MASANGSAPESTMKESLAATAVPSEAGDLALETSRWPGWPGHNVFRMIVPVMKVGSIIGRKGELIKKMCEETGAKIRILDGIDGTSERVVLISGKEEPDAELSPSMNAVFKVFKRANGLTENEGDDAVTATALPACMARLLVASVQAITLIGKGGVIIKGIQEESGATVRVLKGEELPFYASGDERIVDIQGESLKVLKALELVLGHLRKFLVDPSVIPLFDKTYNTQPSTSIAQEPVADSWVDKLKNLVTAASRSAIATEFPSLKRDSLFHDPEPRVDLHLQPSGISLYGHDPAVTGYSSSLARTAGAVVTQVTQSMQIPLSYAEDIIGIGGANIGFIRRTSGAIISVQETIGSPDEITVEIKGSLSQVQAAQQLVQETIASRKEPSTGAYSRLDTGFLSSASAYSRPDTGFLSSYSNIGSSYPSSLTSNSLGYDSAGRLGGYGGYRY